MSTRYPSSQGQRGAALLTAMIIVTLVTTLAAAMVWQQWRAVQVETAERARAQAAWILSGALDFAKLILREDFKARPNYTALTEPWATPLAESRISTFLAVDKANTDDGPEAFLSGNITDAQARYNLNNLIDPDKLVRAEALATLERLCTTVSIETGIASRIATGLLEANASSSTAAAPLRPASVAQLTWLGVDAASVAALAPYVSLLPGTPAPGINVNTASAEVLAAVIKGLDPGTAARLVDQSKRVPFRTLQEFTSQISGVTVDPSARLNVRSDFFEVRGRLRLVDRVLVERSLLWRKGGASTVLERERIASLEQVGG